MSFALRAVEYEDAQVSLAMRTYDLMIVGSGITSHLPQVEVRSFQCPVPVHCCLPLAPRGWSAVAQSVVFALVALDLVSSSSSDCDARSHLSHSCEYLFRLSIIALEIDESTRHII